MNIVIIEDELLTAEDLREMILQVEPKANVVAVLHSVKEALTYFRENGMPNLIFSDIQLGDGLSFDIFNAVELKAPVVFCTAFDEYAIKAFNANGIHYVLKPFNAAKIREAIEKYHTLQDTFSSWTKSIENVFEALQLGGSSYTPKKAESVLVYFQHRIIPIKLREVAVFFIKNEVTYLYTFDNKTYIVNKTLDELQQLDTDLFYRANRQYIISRHAVKEASHYLSRKVSIVLNVPFTEIITISKEKTTPFFDWLTG